MSNDSFQAPTPEEVSPLFPNYSIDAFIAQGGMGAVYLATQKSLDRPVAIKILSRELGQDPSFRASFEAEAKAMARLNHPHLVGVYDYGEVDGMPFIVMEYVDGKALHYSAYGKQIDPSEAGRIVAETCRGLQHAHEHDVLHRDVKPANILLNHDAHAKLGDFGLAMQMDGGDGGLVFGTPGYAAPEVYEGHADARSDTYAAAVILYELITGQLPGDPYHHPSQLAHCDRRFDNLLAKALQPDPAARHQSAGELADDIETILRAPAVAPAVIPVSALTPRAPVRTLASAKKGNGGLALVSVLALAVVGAGAFFMLGGKDKPGPTEPTDAKEDGEGVYLSANETAVIPQRSPEPEARTEEEKPETIAVQTPEDETDEGWDGVGSIVEVLPDQDSPAPPASRTVERTPVKKPSAPQPSFDHMAFLERGRDTLRKTSSALLADHEEQLLKNIEAFERDCKAILRDVGYLTRDTERARTHNLELYIKKTAETGRLPDALPKELPESLADLSYKDDVVKAALREAIDKQSAIDEDLKSALEATRKLYIKGIENQVATLEAEENDADARILQSEADASGKDIDRFIAILRGKDMEPPLLNTTEDGVPGNAPIIGEWCYETSSNRVIYSFDKEGAASNGVRGKVGTWEEVGDGFVVRWTDGSSSTVAVDPSGALRIISPSSRVEIAHAVISPDDVHPLVRKLIGAWLAVEGAGANAGDKFDFREDGTFVMSAAGYGGHHYVEDGVIYQMWNDGGLYKFTEQADGSMLLESVNQGKDSTVIRRTD